ncbi:ABC transporter substrate-binding protein [Gordonia sp. HY285]|uniref:ABC transporter substrate-binding protein n=1 Tax=Gordonia liuliyuniae TaxID=2911517 RepID=A0ABS9IP76_9ACTN|nr:ABC transporter substrate-binding protein [Gordonia liuliyuniae]MCF8587366.1 ABC transporter substrate-binding protein [Gordonia liuliyuniae]MCF8608811.1 ABC transporter substrate-binding protein [Gordonia liuliyuniae]
MTSRAVRTVIALSATTAIAVTAAACGSASTSTTGATVTVTNCGEEVTFDQPLDRLFVNDGGMIATALAAGARDNITAVSSLSRDADILRLEFGQQVDALNEVTTENPTLENFVAARPQVVYAGYNYGMSESRGITVDVLAQHGIDVYQLSEACRQADGESERGTMDPWVALDTDLRNIGTITGHADEGAAAADEVRNRLATLRAAPQTRDRPTVFLFDSGSDTVFTSGSFGGPQGIIDAAGAHNATQDVDDTWTAVSWERLAIADPDVIAFVDYPGQSVEEKIASLRSNPASRSLRAVQEKRFINLPYAMWVSSPLNIDAAEILRKALEQQGSLPESSITTSLDVASLGLNGNDLLVR